MKCKHCGNTMPDDAIFCYHCGARLVEEAPAPVEAAPAADGPAAPVTAPASESVAEAPAAAPAEEAPKAAPAPKAPAAEEAPRKPFLEEMKWNVSEYPDSNVIEKTEDINFDWNVDPAQVPDPPVRPRPQPQQEPKSQKSAEGIRVSEIFDRVVPAEEVKAATAPRAPQAAPHVSEPHVKPQPEAPKPQGEPKPQSEAFESLNVDRFQTVHRKNAEFQELLKREHEKINASGTIGKEQSQADAIAKERFDSRQEEMTMDQFLEKEGAVKLYEPKPLESDVLARIEAQEKQRARQKAEEAARAKALEEARAEAEAQKRAEIEKRNSEVEASAAAAEEIRLAEEEAIRQRTEAEARRKAAAQAAQLEAIAQRKAAQEQAALQEAERRAAEEARAKAEAEQRAREEAEARAREEAAAARAAEEAARQKAEAELNAAREAARIRAQQEANMVAREEARFRQEQERRRHEEEMLRQKQALRERQQRQESEAVVEAQVKDALAQTARMREEEEAKIKAALAGIRGGRFTGTISATPQGAPANADAAAEPLQEVERATQPVSIPTATVESLEARRQVEPIPEAAPAVTPVAPVVPPVEAAEAVTPVAPVIPPVEEAPAVATAPEQIEEAHQMTQNNIDEMARARENFFADFPDAGGSVAAAAAAIDLGKTRMVNKEDLMAGINSTKKISREAVHTADPAAAAATAAEKEAAQQPADIREKMSEMDDLLSQFASMNEAAKAPEKEEAVTDVTELPSFGEQAAPIADDLAAPAESERPAFEPAAEPAVEPLQDLFAAAPEQTVEPTFQQPDQQFFEPAAEPAAQEPQAEDDGLDHMFTGFQMDAEEIRAAAGEFPPAEPAVEAAAGAVSQVTDLPDLDNLDSDGMVSTAADVAKAFATSPATPIGAAATAAAVADAVTGDPGEKPGLQDTMVMPMGKEQIAAAEEASNLSAKEQKRLAKEKAKEAKRLAKEEKQNAKYAAGHEPYEPAEEAPAKSKGGVGRTILMIILILLCIVFALELAGIGIKLLAPTSGAAEFIDNILNNLIHMITG